MDPEHAQIMTQVSVTGGDSGVAVRSASGCQELLGRYCILFRATDREGRLGKAARKDEPLARVAGLS